GLRALRARDGAPCRSCAVPFATHPTRFAPLGTIDRRGASAGERDANGLPADSPARERVSEKVAEVLAQRFLLCVSTIESRKNQQTLCRAYARLVHWGVADLPLLALAGGIGHGGQDVINEIGFDRRLAGRVVALVGCSDADLAALYRGCLFALYPSLYEGWGLPVSEALAH